MKITGNTTLNELLPEGFEFEKLTRHELFMSYNSLSLSFDFKEIKHSPLEEVEEPTFGYFEYVGGVDNYFTSGKIYRCIDPNNIEARGNFIDDDGEENGFAGENYIRFKPSTKEAFDAQNVK